MLNKKTITVEVQEEDQEISYIEFYAGIGGWTMALEQALYQLELSQLLFLSSSNNTINTNANNRVASSSGKNRRRYKLKRLAALDHSDLCARVFAHNFVQKKRSEVDDKDEKEEIGNSRQCYPERPKRKKHKRNQNFKRQKHNSFSSSSSFSIERLSVRQLEDWSSDIFLMSPPCQPHTRQKKRNQSHNPKEKNSNNNDIDKNRSNKNNNNDGGEDDDLNDPRSKSFLKICDWFDKTNTNNNNRNNDKNNNKKSANNYIRDGCLPKLIFLENVIGFESSKSYHRWVTVLQSRQYRIAHFHLSPTQVGLPNDRPRYYCIAILCSLLAVPVVSLPLPVSLAERRLVVETGETEAAHHDSNNMNDKNQPSSSSSNVPTIESMLSYFGTDSDNKKNVPSKKNIHVNDDTNNNKSNNNMDEELMLTNTASTITNDNNGPTIWNAIPELGVVVLSKDDCNNSNNNTSKGMGILPISSFLDDNYDDDNGNSDNKFLQLQVPEKVLQSASSWCFDIVGCNDRRTSCFTHSYGRYVKGTGSIVYDTRIRRHRDCDDYNDNDDDEKKNEDNTHAADSSGVLQLLRPPKEREYCSDWIQDLKLDTTKLRYFSGTELVRLFGFSTNFTFPYDLTNKQQWKLIGNSLNVRIASKIVEMGLLLLLPLYDKHSTNGYDNNDG